MGSNSERSKARMSAACGTISVGDSKCLTREIGLIPKLAIQYVKSLRQILYRCLAPFGADGVPKRSKAFVQLRSDEVNKLQKMPSRHSVGDHEPRLGSLVGQVLKDNRVFVGTSRYEVEVQRPWDLISVTMAALSCLPGPPFLTQDRGPPLSPQYGCRVCGRAADRDRIRDCYLSRLQFCCILGSLHHNILFTHIQSPPLSVNICALIPIGFQSECPA